jgi:hypothetical protein
MMALSKGVSQRNVATRSKERSRDETSTPSLAAPDDSDKVTDCPILTVSVQRRRPPECVLVSQARLLIVDQRQVTMGRLAVLSYLPVGAMGAGSRQIIHEAGFGFGKVC